MTQFNSEGNNLLTGATNATSVEAAGTTSGALTSLGGSDLTISNVGPSNAYNLIVSPNGTVVVDDNNTPAVSADGDANTAEATITLYATLTGPGGTGSEFSKTIRLFANEPPTADLGAGISVEEATEYLLTPGGVATDPDGKTLTFSAAPTATNGTINDNGDGTYDYVAPAFASHTTDTISFTVQDHLGAELSDTIGVTVTEAAAGPTYGDAVSIAAGDHTQTSADVDPAAQMGPVNGGYVGWVEQDISDSPSSSDPTFTDPPDHTGTAVTGLVIDVDNSGNWNTGELLAADNGDPFYHVQATGWKISGSGGNAGGEAGTSIHISGIPYAKYDVIIFVEDTTAHTQENSFTIGADTKTFVGQNGPARWTGTHVEETGAGTGNYAHWRGLTGATASITKVYNGGIGVTGMQIIERTDV